MKILGIQNCELEGFGRLLRVLPEKGARLTVVHPYSGQELPPLTGFDAVVVGGTPISVRAVDDHPFRGDERLLLGDAVQAGVPCLGICFGAQMLARVLGAAVNRMSGAEIGIARVELTETGAGDPLLAGFPAFFPVFQWHADTFSLPGGAGLLVAGRNCRNQMFRHGTMAGMQFHLEVEPEEAGAWAAPYADELAAAGRSADDVVDEVAAADGEMKRLCQRLVANWLDLVRHGDPAERGKEV